LLDLNLPRVQGYEVLREVKSSPYARIPIIVLSGSDARHDVTLCYSLGAAAYLVKPGSPDTAKALLEAVERIWFTLGRTP
jgi:two-component system response regulator